MWRIEVLGIPQVRTPDGIIAVPRGAGQAVLGLLAANPRKPVAREELCAAIWGEDLTRQHNDLLNDVIKRLRQILGVLSSALVTVRGYGYQLAIDPDAIDVHRFRKLASGVKAAMGTGDWGRALQLCGEAEALWHGDTAFAGTGSKNLEDEAEQLGETLLGVRKARLEASVRLTRESCGEAASELRQMVREHPGRDRIRWLLMLALYRAGRPTEATAAYEEALLYHGEAMGVAPAPELAALNARFAVGDQTLLAEPFSENPWRRSLDAA